VDKLKEYKQEDVDEMISGADSKSKFDKILMPSGDYTSIKSFPDRLSFCDDSVFAEDTIFGSNSIFGQRCEFGNQCVFRNENIFYSDSKFGDGCQFGVSNRFRSGNVFGSHCYFRPYSAFGMVCVFSNSCSFGEYTEFSDECIFEQDCSFGRSNSFGGDCVFGYSNVFGEISAFGDGCKFKEIPTNIMSFSLGNLSKDVTLEMMRRDADAHPDPSAFERWANGLGTCPYSSGNFENEEYFINRLHYFHERRNWWEPGRPTMRTWDLIVAIIKEKGWIIED